MQCNLPGASTPASAVLGDGTACTHAGFPTPLVLLVSGGLEEPRMAQADDSELASGTSRRLRNLVLTNHVSLTPALSSSSAAYERGDSAPGAQSTPGQSRANARVETTRGRTVRPLPVTTVTPRGTSARTLTWAPNGLFFKPLQVEPACCQPLSSSLGLRGLTVNKLMVLGHQRRVAMFAPK